MFDSQSSLGRSEKLSAKVSLLSGSRRGGEQRCTGLKNSAILLISEQSLMELDKDIEEKNADGRTGGKYCKHTSSHGKLVPAESLRRNESASVCVSDASSSSIRTLNKHS